MMFSFNYQVLDLADFEGVHAFFGTDGNHKMFTSPFRTLDLYISLCKCFEHIEST